MSYNACSYNYPLSLTRFMDLKELFPDELKLDKPEELNLLAGAMQRVFPRSSSVNHLVLGRRTSGNDRASPKERIVLLRDEAGSGSPGLWTVAAVLGLADGSRCPKLSDLLHESRNLRDEAEGESQAA